MANVQRLFRRGVAELQPYPAGKSLEEMQAEFGGELALMGTNENPLGPSPRALAAIREELPRAHLYPDPTALGLRRAMAARLGIGEDMISLANGADNGLSLVAAALLNEGEEAVMAAPTFAIYTTVVRIMGARPVEVPLRSYVHDLPAMRRAVGERTKLVFLCNPTNPTGTIVPRRELDGFVRDLPEHTVLVLDEAYGDFVNDPEHVDGLSYIREGRPVLSVRTFSKLYGLAGLRIGYLLGTEELVAGINRVREVFPVDRLAQAAALAALDDEEHRRRTLAVNEEGKRYLAAELERLGVACVPSHTNFVFIDLHADSAQIAAALRREGILIRAGGGWKLPTCARITVGTMEHNRRLIAALERLLASGGSGGQKR